MTVARGVAGATAWAAEEVAPGIHSISLPMPTMETVNVFALETERGIALVDAGWPGEDGIAPLAAALASFGADVAGVDAVLLTHGHIDHYGLLDAIRETSGAWSAVHAADAGDAIVGDLDDPGRAEAWATEVGLAGAERRDVLDRILAMVAARRPLVTDRTLRDGEVVDVGGRALRVVHTPGHSPGHVCLVCDDDGVVFTGDHVLAVTTPNVGVRPGVAESPLADYLASLERMRPLRGMTSLPGHEGRTDPAERAEELVAHHETTLGDVRDLVASGSRTVREIAEGVTWSKPWAELGEIDLFLALAETLAHLVVLEERGAVVRAGSRVLEWRVAAG